jgi:hypothetical protein
MSLTNILTNAITSSQTEILMVNPNAFPAGPGVVTIGSEQIHFAAATSNSLLACTRGYNSTTAASALKGATVTLTSNDEPIGVGDLKGTAPVAVANGTQTLAGSSATISMAAATDSVNGYLTSTDHAKITAAVPNTRTVNGHALSGNVTVTASDVSALSTTGGTLSGALTISPTTNQVVLGTTNTTTISATAPASSVVYTLPDAGAAANIVLDHGTNTFSGTTNFNTLVVFNNAPKYTVFDKSSSDSPITLDARLTNVVDVSVDGAITINGPTNGTEMQKVTFQLRQDGSGHAVSFATGAGNFLFNTTFASYTAGAASTVEYVEATYCPDTNLWNITRIVKA